MKTIDISRLTQEQLDAYFVMSVKQNDGLAENWLEAGANVNANNDILRYVIENEDEELFVKLVELNANVNAVDSKGNPILFYALKDVKWLNILANGDLDLNVRDCQNRNAFEVAYNNKDEVLADRLIELGIDIDIFTSRSVTNLAKIIYDSDEKWIYKLINAGASVNVWDENGIPILCNIRFRHDLEMFDKLIENGADVNMRDFIGRTPLMLVKSYYQAVKFIYCGADVNAKDRREFTVLMNHINRLERLVLTYEEQDEIIGIVKLLLDNGADPKARACDGTTPLKLARKSKNKKLINLIREYISKQ